MNWAWFCQAKPRVIAGAAGFSKGAKGKKQAVFSCF
jgi:hypothetical protein